MTKKTINYTYQSQWHNQRGHCITGDNTGIYLTLLIYLRIIELDTIVLRRLEWAYLYCMSLFNLVHLSPLLHVNRQSLRKHEAPAF